MTYNPRIRNKRNSVIQITGSTVSITGSLNSSQNLTVSGNVSGSVGLYTFLTASIITGSDATFTRITGSLLGTASFANNAGNASTVTNGVYTNANNTFTGINVFNISSSSTAVRITQTGTGAALVVEDSTNPDSTPFSVDANGSVKVNGLSVNESTTSDQLNYFSPQKYIEAGVRADNTCFYSVVGDFNVSSALNTSIPFSKVVYNDVYTSLYSDFIPVQPGDKLYGEVWAMRSSGATGSVGTFYVGIARYDKDKLPIATNNGLEYFVASAVTVPSNDVWNKYSGTTTLPLSHVPFGGSDGGPVRYIRVLTLVNYNTGTIRTNWGGLLLRRQVLSRDSGNVTVTVSGNVGIGTTNPQYKLDVNGNTNIVGNLTITGSTILSSVSGTNLEFTTLTASIISASQYLGLPEYISGGFNIAVEGYTSSQDPSIAFVAGIAGGTNQSIQFNESGALSGSTSLVYNKTTGILSGTVAQFINITGSHSGNSTTATTLQTARNINGSSFNGSADITTTNWGTARTLTIGSTGKSVNGSTNYSWTLAEIGAAGTGSVNTFTTVNTFNTNYITASLGITGSDAKFATITGTLNGLATDVTVLSSNTTLTNNDHVVLADATSAQFTITLPLAANSKFRQYIVKKTDSSANKIIISGSSSETIDGLLGKSIGTQYESLTVVNDGVNKWFII